MHIAVCDDSAFDRELIVELLHIYFAQKPFQYKLAQYNSGINLVCDVEDGCWFDIIFLDIYMNGLLGIDAAHKLRALGFDGAIIFLTASADFAVDSYDAAAAGYLLKPHSFDKLCRCMDRVLQDFDTCTYQVQQRMRIVRVPYTEITFIESSNSKCILHRSDGSCYIVYKKLGKIEAELSDNRFLRCHQSYLVNMDFIAQADRQFHLTTGESVLIRQRDLKSIRQAYLDYVQPQANPKPIP